MRFLSNRLILISQMGSKKILLIKPLNRVEGDLEVKVEIKNGKVIDAYSSGVLFRGFEKLLLRRDPMDAVVFSRRVCCICSISHSTASSLALRNAYGAKMPANAYFIRNIALATEVLLNHLTHLYAFFLIDFTNKKYSEKENYLEILNRFVFLKGSSYIKAMEARKNFLAFLGLFVGKWPNTLALQPGGVTKTVNTSEIIRAKGILSEFKDFIENDLFGCKIECFLDNKTQTDLNKWLEDNHHARSDLGIFIKFARDIGLENLGKGPDAFLCCASYEMSDGLTFYKSGYFDNTNKPFDEEKITESIKYSYFEGYQDGRHPASGITNPDADKKGAYSWVKSPRYNREVVEVGPLARLVINNNSLARNLWHDSGANAYTRSIIRI